MRNNESNPLQYELSAFYRNAQLYDDQNYDVIEDISYYLSCAQLAGGSALELACGTGRVSIPLLKANIDLYGLDLSKEFITRLHEQLKGVTTTDRFIVADMRQIPFQKPFNLIFIPFNAFLHLYTNHDVERCLQSIHAQLNPGGYLAFDISNPSVKLLARNPEKKFFLDDFPLDKEGILRCQVFERNYYDYKDQILHVSWFFEYPDSSQDKVFYLEMRMFFPQEMDALLYYNGFEIVEKYGTFTKEPFKSASPKQVFLCKRK